MTPSEFQDYMRKSLAPYHIFVLSILILLGSMVDFRLHYSEAGYQSADFEEMANANEREFVFEPLCDWVLISEDHQFAEFVTGVFTLQFAGERISLVSLLLGSHYIALPPPVIV